jgi:Cell wall hydrolyses involved in spore germination
MKTLQSFLARFFKYFRRMTKKQYRECIILVTGIFVIALIGFASHAFQGRRERNDKVYVGGQNVIEAEAIDLALENEEAYEVQNSLLGILEGVKNVEVFCNGVNKLKTTYVIDEVMVGQMFTNQASIRKVALVNEVKIYTNVIENQAYNIVANNQMSEKDYDALLHVVEAEATGEGYKGKVLIANVILNRIADSRFPNTAYDVIWDKSYGTPQFAPTVDGRIHTVVVSDETREAVNNAINGEDYSEGALYFMARADISAYAEEWFDNLVRLFSHENHEFYRLEE